MGTINKPNLVLPLASSYNERGVNGFGHSITNSEDQRKVNCLYDISKNSITGQSGFNLVKRPGVTDSATNPYGASTQAAYLLANAPQIGAIAFSAVWLFSTDSAGGNDHIVSDNNTSTKIFSASGAYWPCFIDRTLINGVDTLVYQAARNASAVSHRVFFSGASASIGAAWTEITDGDFTGLFHRGKMEHMDGFAFILERNSRIFNSDINSLSAWNPSNFATKQIVQDVPVGLMKHKNQILAFGKNSFEAFYNAGNTSGSPLTPIKQLQGNIGLSSIGYDTFQGSTYYVEYLGKTYFIGNGSGSSPSSGVYAYDGSTATKISTSYADKILFTAASTPVMMAKFGFHGRTAISFLLDSRQFLRNTTKRWLMYFPEWNDWFEWTSSIYGPITNGEFFLGCLDPSRVYTFETTASVADNWQDAGVSYQFMTQFTLPNSGPELKRMGTFGVNGNTSSAGTANTILVEFSDNDYQTFKTAGTISLSSDNKTIKRGGAYKNRAVRLSNTNAVETRLQSFIALVK